MGRRNQKLAIIMKNGNFRNRIEENPNNHGHNKIRISLNLFLQLIFLLVILASLNAARPAADDYCFGALVREKGSLGMFWSYMTTWTGNYSTYALIATFLGISNSPSTFNLILLFNLGLQVYLLGFSVKKIIKVEIPFRIAVGLFAAAIIFLQGGYSGGSLLWYSAYWMGGFIHLYPASLGIALSVLVISKEIKNRKPLLVVGSFVLAGFGFAESMAWGTTWLLIAIYLKLRNKQEPNIKSISILGCMTLVCTLVAYSLPGTALREKAMDAVRGGPREPVSIQYLFDIMKYMLLHSNGIFSIRGLVASFLIGILLGRLVNRSLNKEIMFLSIAVLMQLFFGATAGVFSYFAPWHGITSSVLLLLLFISIFANIGIFRRASFLRNVAAEKILILLTLFAILVSLQELQVLDFRKTNWDNRYFTASKMAVPARDLNGNYLVEDTDTAWVLNCYNRWLKIS